ncbi:MAG: hypothetical protein R6V53_03825 [Candidatus Woesearchaeota archaeon]
MTQLVALLSTGKGTWGQVAKVLRSQEWEKIFLITNQFGKEKFQPDAKTELIVADFNDDIMKLKKEILSSLKDKVTGIEVAVNMCSGSGKEHTALVTALQELGVGFRFVDLSCGQLEIL